MKCLEEDLLNTVGASFPDLVKKGARRMDTESRKGNSRVDEIPFNSSFIMNGNLGKHLTDVREVKNNAYEQVMMTRRDLKLTFVKKCETRVWRSKDFQYQK